MPPTKQLFILRHAKSSWDDPDLADGDRPLAKRGRRDALRVAARVRSMHVGIDLVLCSSSLRTRETLRPLREALRLDDAHCLIEDDLYAAEESELLGRLHRVPDDIGSVMVIGHNPGLQELALRLCGEAGGEIPRRIKEKLPTAALVVLRTTRAWGALGPGSAEPVDLLLPRDLH